MNNKNLIPYLLGLATLTSFFCFSNRVFGQDRVKELLDNSVTIIDSNGLFTSEFKSALRNELKGVRVLSLGETTHEDGGTFEHKTQLVKLLHEEFGFNVLAFEFGFYGNWKTYQKLGKEPIEEVVKYSGWSNSEYAFPIYEYFAETKETSNPLIYAGFDGEKVPDGIPNVKGLLSDMGEELDFTISEGDRIILDSMIHAVYGRLGNPVTKAFSFEGRKRAKQLVTLLKSELVKRPEPILNSYNRETYLVYKYTLETILFAEEVSYIGNFKNIVRDKQMAERVKWLTDSIYRNEKIILWGASSHFARNMVSIERDMEAKTYEYYPYYQMGDWLNHFYGDTFYSMVFTAGSGEIGTVYPENHRFKQYEDIRKIEPPLQESFEGIANQSGEKTLFVGLRGAGQESWLKNKFVAYPYGYEKDKAQWDRVTDGFYFIKTMKPDKWIRKE